MFLIKVIIYLKVSPKASFYCKLAYLLSDKGIKKDDIMTPTLKFVYLGSHFSAFVLPSKRLILTCIIVNSKVSMNFGIPVTETCGLKLFFFDH